MASTRNPSLLKDLLEGLLSERKDRLCFRHQEPERRLGDSRAYFTLGPVDEKVVEEVSDGPRYFLNLIFELRHNSELNAYVGIISTRGKGADFAHSALSPCDWRIDARATVLEWAGKETAVFCRLINFNWLLADAKGEPARVDTHDRERVGRWIDAIDETLRALFQGAKPTWKQSRDRLSKGQWSRWPELGQLMLNADQGAVPVMRTHPENTADPVQAVAVLPEDVAQQEPTGTESLPGGAPLMGICFSYLPDQPKGADRTAFYMDALAGQLPESTDCTVNRKRYQRITVAQFRSLGLDRVVFESVIPEHVEGLDELDPQQETRYIEEGRATRSGLIRALRPEVVVVQSRRCMHVIRPELEALTGTNAVVLVLMSPSMRAHQGSVKTWESHYKNHSLRHALAAALAEGSRSGLTVLAQTWTGAGWAFQPVSVPAL